MGNTCDILYIEKIPYKISYFSIQIVNLYTTILSKDKKLNKYSVDSDAKKEQ